jgi:TPR repeat protein
MNSLGSIAMPREPFGFCVSKRCAFGRYWKRVPSWTMEYSDRGLVSTTARVLWVLVGVAALGGCTDRTTVGDAMRPENPNAADVRGSQSVYVVEAKGEPLIVDWQPEQRGDLEVSMREGVAVVEFDNRGMKLLKDCHIDGKYGFIGVNTKEQVVSLESDEEIKANLPGGGLGILAKIGAEIGRSQSLDIALVMVGKKKTTWGHASKQEVKGDCSGATHFIRGATVGAFAMRSGAKGKARTVAELFGAGLDASASSGKSIQNADGTLEACRKAAPEAEQPPSQCGALLRIELVKLDEQPKPTDAPKTDEATAAADSQSESCPAGFVFSAGKCARPEADQAHVCKSGDVRDCTLQCEKGSAPSCDILGYMFVTGAGVTKNPSEGATLFQKACNGGHANGCFNFGVVLQNGQGVPKDEAKAMSLFDKACSDGVAIGCDAAAVNYYYGKGVAQDGLRAAKLFALGCRGGARNSCSNLGAMYNGGIVVPKNEKLAANLFKLACDGGVAVGCGNFAYMVEFGKGVTRDAPLAAKIYERACAVQTSECVWLGAVHQAGIGVKKDSKRALAEFRKSCDALITKAAPDTSAEGISCVLVNELAGGKKQFDTAPFREAAVFWDKACQGGVERDCTGLALVHFGLGDRAAGKRMLTVGCKAGDPWACVLEKTGKFK